MTDLTEANLERILSTLSANARALNPYVIIVPPQMYVTAGHMAFFQKPMRKVSGARKRKLALYWR